MKTSETFRSGSASPDGAGLGVVDTRTVVAGITPESAGVRGVGG